MAHRTTHKLSVVSAASSSSCWVKFRQSQRVVQLTRRWASHHPDSTCPKLPECSWVWLLSSRWRSWVVVSGFDEERERREKNNEGLLIGLCVEQAEAVSSASLGHTGHVWQTDKETMNKVALWFMLSKQRELSCSMFADTVEACCHTELREKILMKMKHRYMTAT